MASTETQSLTANIGKFFKDSSIYSIGMALGKAVSFISTPILVALLTPAELGVLDLLGVFGAVVGIFLNAGVVEAINRNYYDDATDEHRAAVVGTGLLWRILTSGLLLTGMALAAVPVTNLLLGEATDPFVLFYLLTLLNLAVMGPQTIAYTLYRVRLQSGTNTAFSVSGAVLSLITLIVFVWWLHRGIKGALEASVAANLAVTVVMLPGLLKSAKLRIRKDVLRGILSYGLPFLPHQLAIFLLFGADRYFLQHMQPVGQQDYDTTTEVGLYSYAYRIAMIMSLALEGASRAWTPFLFSIMKREDARKIHALTARYMLMVFVSLAVFLVLFGRDLIVLLAMSRPDYWTAAAVVPWVVGGYLFLGVYQVFGAAVGIPKRTHLLLLFSGTGMVLNLILNWYLVPEYRMIGAAVATLISYAVMGLLSVIVTQRVYHVPYEWGRIFAVACAGCICAGTGAFLPEANLFAGQTAWLALLGRLACIGVFPLVVILLGGVSGQERRIGLTYAQKFLNRDSRDD